MDWQTDKLIDGQLDGQMVVDKHRKWGERGQTGSNVSQGPTGTTGSSRVKLGQAGSICVIWIQSGSIASSCRKQPGEEEKKWHISAHANGGPRFRVCARWPSTPIFRRTCLQSHFQTSPPTPQKSYPKFRKHRTTFEIFTKKQGGFPNFFWG